MIQNLRVHAKNNFLMNEGAGSKMLTALTLANGGQTKNVRMFLPTSFSLYHSILSLAETRIGESNAAFKKSESSYSASAKATAGKVARASAELSLDAARKARLFNPSSVRACTIMATSLVALKKHREAIAPLSMAISLSASAEYRARLLFARAQTYHGMDDCQHAIADYEKLLSMPECKLDKSIVMVYLGGSHARSGNLDKGISLLKEAFSMKLKNRLSEHASDTIYDIMFVLGSLHEKGRRADADSLLDQWSKWRKL